MRNGIVIEAQDNVAVAIYELKAGDELTYEADGQTESILLADDIPLFHKVARTNIQKGEKIIKYGEFIGIATSPINKGEHVHIHNCASSDELKHKSGE